MAEFNIRADAVDVEQIMQQIRSRIRDKRGVDYTEEQIQAMAGVKLEQFLDPRGVRSDMVAQFRSSRPTEPVPTFTFDDTTLYDSHRTVVRWIRRLLRPLLKLFFNPNPLIQALHIQATLNADTVARRDLDALYYEVMHNLVLEMTRLSIDVKNLKMRVESLSSRLDFNERRARALESVVQYRSTPEADRPAVEAAPAEPRSSEPRGAEPRAAEPRAIQPRPEAAAGAAPEGPGQRSRRRRRRRGRRGTGTGQPASEPGGAPGGAGPASADEGHEPAEAGYAAGEAEHESPSPRDVPEGPDGGTPDSGDREP
ncbi:MAG TPA: hypothetical protein VNE16_06100 [Vicinamibacterales bacterium]|nr:hypothetical protein [Vicinamibacterales bacterium]